MAGLFGGSTPSPPPLPPPVPMPDPAAQDAAKKKSIAAQQARSGRMSTILTQGNGTAGTSDTLGG